MERFYKNKFKEYQNNTIKSIEENFRLFSPIYGDIPFLLFDTQKRIINDYETTTTHNYVNKFRQGGTTNSTLAYLTSKALFSDTAITIGIMSMKIEQGKHKLRLIKDLTHAVHLPILGLSVDDELLINEHSTKLKFANNGSNIITISSSSKTLHGHHFDYLFIDDFSAFDEEDLLMQCYVSAKKIIICNTPTTKNSVSYSLYQNGLNGVNNFKVTDIKWFEDPRFSQDLAWETPDGFLLYDEKHFTPESFNYALSLGLRPTSTWYRNICDAFGNNKRKIDVELNGVFLDPH